jgi:hypothetical protein
MLSPACGSVTRWAQVAIAVGLLALGLYFCSVVFKPFSLILNLVTFPTAPAAAGLVDLGPGVGAWYGVTLLLLLRYLPRLNGVHAPEAAMNEPVHL